MKCEVRDYLSQTAAGVTFGVRFLCPCLDLLMFQVDRPTPLSKGRICRKLLRDLRVHCIEIQRVCTRGVDPPITIGATPSVSAVRIVGCQHGFCVHVDDAGGLERWVRTAPHLQVIDLSILPVPNADQEDFPVGRRKELVIVAGNMSRNLDNGITTQCA